MTSSHAVEVRGVTNPLRRRVLTINRGSATLKASLYETREQNELLISMAVDEASEGSRRLKVFDPRGATVLDRRVVVGDRESAFEQMIDWLDEHQYLPGLAAAGHRLVQGGPKHTHPERITPETLANFKNLIPLDPDHMPAAIQVIQLVARKFPGLPQVACFDTAFHGALPLVARMYALPRKLYEQGILRYGFHGLSYEYVMSELRALERTLANGRVIIAHMGSGASMVAVQAGKSMDTSMGFTPIEGLVMSTRSGDVDPGILLYLLQQEKIPARELSKLLNRESGLLGVSGTSGDMRTLLEKVREDTRAEEAISLFCYRAKKYVGAYAAVLGGVDVLVFAGGIGEHTPVVRKRICSGLEFLGIRLDDGRNDVNESLISSTESQVKVRIIKTNEDLMIVRHVRSALGWPDAAFA